MDGSTQQICNYYDNLNSKPYNPAYTKMFFKKIVFSQIEPFQKIKRTHVIFDIKKGFEKK